MRLEVHLLEMKLKMHASRNIDRRRAPLACEARADDDDSRPRDGWSDPSPRVIGDGARGRGSGHGVRAGDGAGTRGGGCRAGEWTESVGRVATV